MPAIANGQAVVQPSTTTADATTALSDAELLGAMIPEVYEQLRNLAQNYLRGERVNHTLQATALVHEAYLRLRDQRKVDWQNRAQFLGIAAQMMRRVLKNYASARTAAKRGGEDQLRLTLDEAIEATTTATRRFSRRQDGWFRKDPRVVWVPWDAPDRLERAVAAVAALD